MLPLALGSRRAPL